MSARDASEWSADAGSWWLGATAARFPDAPALRVERARASFAELAAASEDSAAMLAAAGVSPGDRVAVVAPASRSFVELVHATHRLGAVVVPMSPKLTAAELDAQLAAADPRLVIGDDALVPQLTSRSRSARVVALGALDRMARARIGPPAVAESSAPHSMLMTSGTTGAPKAVALTCANHHAGAVAAARRLDYRCGQRWLAALPLYHVGGLAVILRAAILGAEVLLQDAFDVTAVAGALTREEIAHASLVPTMLYRLLAELEAAGSAGAARSCCFLVGGAALDEPLAARAARLGLDVRATYGLTETASQVTTSERGELDRHPGTSGKPLDGVALRIDSPDREGFGEVCVRGSQVAAIGLRDGWLATGDIARTDEAGRLFVGSRRVDLIVSGGENVRSEEVERVLEAHPSVAVAGVYGMPDAEWGHRVAAVVVPRAGARIDEVEIDAWCRARLAPHKLPRVIEVRRSLPRTASGKLQRGKLHDRSLPD